MFTKFLPTLARKIVFVAVTTKVAPKPRLHARLSFPRLFALDPVSFAWHRFPLAKKLTGLQFALTFAGETKGFPSKNNCCHDD